MPCKFVMAREPCRFGENCRFSHDSAVIEAARAAGWKPPEQGGSEHARGANGEIQNYIHHCPSRHQGSHASGNTHKRHHVASCVIKDIDLPDATDMNTVDLPVQPPSGQIRGVDSLGLL